MVTKAKPRKKDMTKAEIIGVIKRKTARIPARFQPQVRDTFLKGLEYKTKPQLKRIASRMRVEWDKHGWGINLS